MAKSRKGKRYDAQKHARQRIENTIKRLAKDCYLMNGCCFDRPQVMFSRIADADYPAFCQWIAKTPMHWSSWMCVFAVNQLGQAYQKSEVHTAPRPMNSTEASDYFSPYLKTLTESIKSSDFISVGYVNTFNDHDLSAMNDELIKMFIEHGAMDPDKCKNNHFKSLLIKALEAV